MKLAPVRRSSRERGQAVIEFGLSLVVFFLITFGIVEYSRVQFINTFCAYGAQEGARYASLRGGDYTTACATYTASNCNATAANVTSYVTSLAVGMDTSKMTVSTVWPSGANSSTNNVKVTVSYTYNPLLVAVLPSQLTLTSTSTMPILW